MPRTPEVCSHVFTPFSQFFNGLHGRSNVLPRRRLNAAFSRRIFFRHNQDRFLRRSLTAACLLILLITHHASLIPTYGQSATATLSGIVIDQNNAVVPNVSIAVISIAHAFQRSATTNDEGTFVVPLLPPGNYIVKAEREGFTPAEVRDVVLNVNDYLRLKISLKVGGVDQTVDIVDTPPLIDKSPAVATTVDRQFVSQLPLNGRSFQTLIALTPGTVLTKADFNEGGQFSVNGQRANTNYVTVDGVSTNASINPAGGSGQASAGTVPAFSIAGGTNNLVSVDALQEFKVQTSTYAAEFGRSPGAQVQILTRSGTTDFHGTLFNYFRNDVLDANDWFGNRNRLAKPPLRQNDFGGVLGGPILIPRFGEGGRQPWYNGRRGTFFFFSYEGLRLRQPIISLTDVPSLSTRQNAVDRIRPYLNAFPLPNGPLKGNGLAEFAASFSNPATLDATSIRIDHTLNNRFTLFGRYNYAPSSSAIRGSSNASLSSVTSARLNTQTLTLGGTIIATSRVNNELRFNHTRVVGSSLTHLDSFGGAVVPEESLIFPPFTSSQNGLFAFSSILGTRTQLILGRTASNQQRQVNLVNNFSVVTGSHQLKLGVDYRRLAPIINLTSYRQVAVFNSVLQAATGTALQVQVGGFKDNLRPVITNLSLYGQDTWRLSERLSLTYGVRYELNPPPTEQTGNDQFTVTGLDNPTTLALAPRGTRIYETTYNNFAPRIGVAYQLSERPGREMILRGGFGVFYDTGNGSATSNFIGGNFPFQASSGLLLNVPFPLTAAQLTPPAFNPNTPVNATFIIFDPQLKLPYTLQWNASLEHSLGSNQAFSATYVGAAGRRLLRSERLVNPNPNFPVTLSVVKNTSTSDYHAMQLQYDRRLSRGLQTLLSYTWGKSLDINSNDSSSANTPATRLDPRLDRGPSDFDVRHVFSGAVTYQLPTPDRGMLSNALFRTWSIDTIFTARSATPVNITYTRNIGFGSFPALRPDLVPGIPLYLDDPNAPGGRRINNTRVTIPGNPNPQIGPFLRPVEARQGTLGRNVLRGFPVYQIDMTLRRQFQLTEELSLRFAADFFNILNHPNFADPVGVLTDGNFGVSTVMLSQSLGRGGTGGGFNPLYQIGGPRSIQLSLKLQF
ncbi:MAG TPA: TonB-dependent receptor [Pyrinomonadaceae bacterium]|nr:TonB-dependent receptor [Pyrinomonadaceae bacterium]